MAYNPFDFFRRNQKTLFAVLTVIVMFMFVLSSGVGGQGDFFNWLPDFVRGKRGGGDVMAVIDGEKVFESELRQRAAARQYANEYMAAAAQAAVGNLAERISTDLGGASDAGKRTFEDFLAARRNQYLDPQSLRMTQMMVQQGYMTAEQGQGQLLQGREQNLRRYRGQFEIMAENSEAKKEDKELALAGQYLLDLEATLARTGGRGHYFVNAPLTAGSRDKDLLEFELWLRKARKMGIRFSVAEAGALLTRECYNRIQAKDLAEIEKEYLTRPGFTKEGLYLALADEFAVRAAQTAVLGTPVVKAGNPAVTPYDAFKYFQKECNAADYAAVAVPVENYLDRVTAAPTEGELRELFTKHRTDEPDPAKERPGFKEPRKLKLQWLEAKGDEPFYKTAAFAALKLTEAHAKAANFTTLPVHLAGWGLLPAAAVLTVPEPALTGAYEEYVRQFGISELDRHWFPQFGTPTATPIGPSVVRPGNLAGAAAAAAGSLLTRASPLTAPLVLDQQAAFADRQARLAVLAPLLHPGPAGGMTPLGRFALAAAALPRPLPIAVMRNELAVKVQDKLARDICSRDLVQFYTELTKLGAKTDKAEARAYVETFIRERGLKSGASADFRDRYHMDDDPGLDVLEQKLDQGHSFPGMSGRPLVRFGPQFFFDQDPRTGRLVEAKALYAPQPWPETGSIQPTEFTPVHLVWRTDEKPAVTPRTLDEARAKVVAAWKEIKARELARRDAEELAKKAEALGPNSVVVTDGFSRLHTELSAKFDKPAAKDRVRYFLLNNVAPVQLQVQDSLRPNEPAFSGFTLQATKDIPYPTQEMENELVKAKDKPLSTTLVLPDQGKNTYYVFALRSKTERDAEEFGKLVYTSAISQLGQVVMSRLKMEESQEARRLAVELLKAEFRYEKESPRVSEKGGSSAAGEEV